MVSSRYGEASSGVRWIQSAAGAAYAAYMSGEEPEDPGWVLDFGEWASVYRTWLTRQADYRNEVQRLQHGTPSLAGLVRVSDDHVVCFEMAP